MTTASTLFYTLLLFGSYAFGQSGMVVSGGNASNGTGSISYSLGQVDYQQGTGSGGSFHSGNQQPLEIFENPVDGISELELDLKVFPNPTQQIITIESGTMNPGLKYRISDADGKLLSEGTVYQQKTTIDLGNVASGVYFLELSDQSNLLKSFKLVKTL